MALGPMPAGIPGGGLPPGMPSPGGGPPPGMMAPPANVGPVTIPQGNPGNVMQAMQKLQAAYKIILEALPQIPLGTPLHQSVLKVADNLGKHMSQAKEEAQMTAQTLMQALKSQRNEGQMAALQRAAPPQQTPNQPPAMTPPGAPPGGMAA